MSEQTFIPFSRPSIGEDEIQEVVSCLRSGWITTGPRCERLEADFRRMTGAEHALAFSSCTAALHVAMLALGFRHGDEVIVPALTWPATANVIVNAGAKPVFCDIDRLSWNIDPVSMASVVAPQTKAVIPVHYAGLPVDLRGIRQTLDGLGRPDIKIIEDAAHALGASYEGFPIGNCAAHGTAVACFSFHPIKNITTGEGGMSTTADAELAASMKKWRFHGIERDAWKAYSTGKSGMSYDVLLPGLKYNLTDLHASLGVHQLRRLQAFNERRSEIARYYSEELSRLDEVTLAGAPTYRYKHAWHLFPILVPKGTRAGFIERMTGGGIGTGLHFEAVHLTTYYQRTFGCHPGQCAVAEDVCSRIVSLPLYPLLTDGQAERV
ncbi:MAG: DegT/DnrJ/EryC1/StrS aminotransferase family protein, partial [Acidobacteria bacterium]